MAYFNWKETGTVQTNPDQECAVKLPGFGQWAKKPCFPDRNYFICQRVSARYVKRPQIWRRNQRDLYVGSKYAVHCTAFVGTGGEVRFRLADSVNETYIVESGDYRDASVTFEAEDIQYVEVGDGCFQKSSATLSLIVTEDLNGTQVSCCSFDDDNFTSCSESLDVELGRTLKNYIFV
ncbi:hypothetical protein ElyMa_007002000 [Elysia marginata]|uniref:C-type lectin domain-containing protein n=1 Tax=Elysia marginata TaxID=1093978 RepID=A0AAV4JQJ7_9GAST|nr:hypothetical protein ElyMa_007002000 [Elysia marginata]